MATLFLRGLIFRVILGVRQTSLFGSWVRLELNMLIFVAGLRSIKLNLERVAIKYFIAQSVGSRIFLGVLGLSLIRNWSQVIRLSLGTRLLFKLGVAPFHTWFIRVMSSISWEFFIMASTLQKILPLFLFSLFTFFPLTFFLLASVVVSLLGRLNQRSTKKLLAYSSIFSAVWLLSCEINFSVIFIYLFVYTSTLAILIFLLASENRHNINETLYIAHKIKILIFLARFLSLGGSPPFVGFYAKILVLQIIFSIEQTSWAITLVVRSIFLLYLYMRFFYYRLVLSETSVRSVFPSGFKRGARVIRLFILLRLPWL